MDRATAALCSILWWFLCPIKQNGCFVSLSKNKRSPICRLLPVYCFFGITVWFFIHAFLHVYAEKRAK